MSKNSQTGSIFPFLIGLGIGAAAALLLAPKTGDQLREDLSDAIDDGVDQVQKHGKTFKRRSSELVNAAQDKAQDAIEQAKDVAARVKKAGA